MFDWKTPTGGIVSYPLTGVEEIIPLARLVEYYGPCIGVIEPRGDTVYELPNTELDTERTTIHTAKLLTKLPRQKEMLRVVGRDLAYLEAGVL